MVGRRRLGPQSQRTGSPPAALFLCGALLAVVALFLPVTSATTYADDPVSVRSLPPENQFPTAVVFRAEASSTAADVTTVRLLLRVGPESGVEQAVAFPLDQPARRVSPTFRLPAFGYPSGVTFTYTVEAEDAAGNRTRSAPQTLWYADTRHTWTSVTEGPVTVHYYGDKLQTARQHPAGGRDAQSTTGALLGVELRRFDIVLHDPASDASGAQTRAEELDGVRSRAYPDWGLVHVAAEPLVAPPEDHARHEATHMFVGWALPGSTTVPAWLNEGLAVWSERSTRFGYQMALDSWLRERETPSLRTLIGFPRGHRSNFAAYLQSWSVVHYLMDTHGREKFQALFRALPDGEEEALQRTYGLTVDGLDAAWRASVGLQPRSYDIARPTPLPIAGEGVATTASETPRKASTMDMGGMTLAALGGVAVVAVTLYLRSRSSRTRSEDL